MTHAIHEYILQFVFLDLDENYFYGKNRKPELRIFAPKRINL